MGQATPFGENQLDPFSEIKISFNYISTFEKSNSAILLILCDLQKFDPDFFGNGIRYREITYVRYVVSIEVK